MEMYTQVSESLAGFFPDCNPPATHLFSVETGDAPLAGEGRARRWAGIDTPVPDAPAGISNLHENLLAGVAKSANAPFLGRRPIVAGVPGAYVWETYAQVLARVSRVAHAINFLGLKNANVGLFSINRPEWVIAEHACYMFGNVTVPLYDTLGHEAIEYIVHSTKTALVFATADKAAKLVEIAKKIPSLKTIVLMDQGTTELLSKSATAGVRMVLFSEMEVMGEAHPAPTPKTGMDTVATICYTSGTTGMPKGVVLTHKNLLSFVAGQQYLSDRNASYKGTASDVHISYLPLAHIFERVVQAALTNWGGSIGFFQGDALKLLDDVAELKPTVFLSVPRLYNRIFDKINAGVKAKGGIAEYLFNRAYTAKKAYLKRGYQAHTLWDRLVFDKVKARLGGRVRFMCSGAAPISSEIADFMRICFGATWFEGYGQTETSAAAAMTLPDDLTSGHVGVPFATCIVKLRDVPAMKYTSQDKPFPRGEICIKGANIFQGYYNAPDKTAEVLVDGWNLTGDVGTWDAQGRLKIIDRVKNIFKLAQGEYIAPEKVEVVLNKFELVGQSFVYGDSLQAHIVAVVVPDWETLNPWAQQNGFKHSSLEEVCADPKVNALMLKLLMAHCKENDLKGFETPRTIHLDAEPFSAENQLLSPTFKLKRHEAKNKYLKQIEQMYKQ